ncbi:putative F-box protein-like [Capsicum annuum]|nr:putative F-box protein-like [Capsicum annuum]
MLLHPFLFMPTAMPTGIPVGLHADRLVDFSSAWIPNHVAVKIALDLRKLLVDNSLLDVSQTDLEANLFKLEQSNQRRTSDAKQNSYLWYYLFWEDFNHIHPFSENLLRFHHQRVPLVILVCGTACVGKSTIATLLAQRLNLPNVLQTEMVYELLGTSTDAPLTSSPVWTRDFSSSEDLITEFCRECRIIWKGLAGDLRKATNDGKPIIIEDRSLLMNFMTIAGETVKDLGADQIPALKRQTLCDLPIFVPIVIKMADFDHKDKDKVITNLLTIQDYLCSFTSQGLTVDVPAATFPQTLDWLHNYLLQVDFVEATILSHKVIACPDGYGD